MNYDEFMDHIYDLAPVELRRLAYEALLITDGPAYVTFGGNKPTAAGVDALKSLNDVFKDVDRDTMLSWRTKITVDTWHEYWKELSNGVRDRPSGSEGSAPV